MTNYDLASNATTLKNSPIFKQTITDIQKHLFDQWLNSSPSDANHRETLFLQLKAVDMIVNQLDSYIFDYQQQQYEQSE